MNEEPFPTPKPTQSPPEQDGRGIIAVNIFLFSCSFLLLASYLLIYVQLPPDTNDFIRFLSLFIPFALPLVFAVLWYKRK